MRGGVRTQVMGYEGVGVRTQVMGYEGGVYN